MKKYQYKVSIIIPIFDVKDYILECLNSVLNQTLKEIEIICIDDCSPENEYKIIKKLQKKDNRIVYIRHKKNLFQGGARNTGIEIAKGEYIFFLDSDDWIEPSCIETLYHTAKINNANIVSYEFDFYENGSFSEFKAHKQMIEGWTTVSPQKFNILQRVCYDKLYKSDIFLDKDIRFPSNTKIEDIEFYWKLFTKYNIAYHIKKNLYHYRQREGSTMTQLNNELFYINFLKITQNIYKYLKKENLLKIYSDAFNERITINANALKVNKEKYLKEIYLFLKEEGFHIQNFLISSVDILIKISEDFISRKKAILYGFNDIARLIYEVSKNHIYKIIDTNRYGQNYENIEVINLQNLKDINNKFFIITANKIEYINEIKSDILNSFPQATIVSLSDYYLYKENNEITNSNKQIIATLTTYGKRINSVEIAINSILEQEKKADKILLWLAKDEFNFENIPKSLKKLHDDKQIEIKFCKDIKSYKKLIPTLDLYKDEIIITFDDDMIYDKRLVQKLYEEHLRYPETIICGRGHKMLFDSKRNILPYKDWTFESDDFMESDDIFPTGVCGILYPPNCFYKDIQNEELFMSLAPNADDIWFKTMTLLNNRKSKVLSQNNKEFSKQNLIETTQENALFLQNKNQGLNDIYLDKVFKFYSLDEKIKF